MNLELFSVPVFIGNLDLKKIKLTLEMGQAFFSKTPSSYKTKNHFDPESAKYLTDTIAALLKEKYQSFNVRITHIWRNKYTNHHYQEPHIHAEAGVQFSFIIYEKVNKPHTVFYNPAKYLIDAADAHFVLREFTPEVRKGQIIVFPSYIEHMVDRNSDQVTISGNLNFKLNV
tara:strand:+ start:656 stop:1171 length:516 start_codon:yes stop_codon:yes gene_type:complete